jgi:hypothetical protein
MAKNKQQQQQQGQLDAAHGSAVVDPSFFRAHAAKYEVSLEALVCCCGW